MIRVAKFVYDHESRQAAHRAGLFALATIIEPGAGPIEYAESGKPTTRQGVHVSIAHSGGCAIAATGSANVGVDIELLGRKISRPLREYIVSDEEKLLFKTDEDYLCAWVVKESVLKMRGSGVTGPPRSLVLILNSRNNIYECEDKYGLSYVQTFVEKGYIIAVAYEEKGQQISIH